MYHACPGSGQCKPGEVCTDPVVVVTDQPYHFSSLHWLLQCHFAFLILSCGPHPLPAGGCACTSLLPSVSLSSPLVILFCMLKASVLMSKADCMLLPEACGVIVLKVWNLKVDLNTRPWSVTGPMLASFNVLCNSICSETESKWGDLKCTMPVP